MTADVILPSAFRMRWISALTFSIESEEMMRRGTARFASADEQNLPESSSGEPA